VDIQLSTTATSVNLSAHNKFESFIIENDGISSYIACQSLVLAAGPWTPLMYHKLFPSSAITLKATLNAGDWILFQNPLPATKKTIAFIALDEIVGEKLELVGGMVTRFG